MNRTAFALTLVVWLSACTSNPVPEGYAGPLSYIRDSVTNNAGSADFFYLTKVNGEKIKDSASATAAANYGNGFVMYPRILGRKVPARPSTYSIVGRTRYAAPILELTHAIYEVSGDVEFSPLPDREYLVKGELGEDHSAVWIEDATTGQVVGKKIEIKGSARLGILEK